MGHNENELSRVKFQQAIHQKILLGDPEDLKEHPGLVSRVNGIEDTVVSAKKWLRYVAFAITGLLVKAGWDALTHGANVAETVNHVLMK